MTSRGVARLALALLLLGACQVDVDDEEDSPPVEQSVQVTAFDFSFEPATLALEPGTRASVEFVNSGENMHSFTVPDLDLEVEAEGGETTSLEFAVPDEPGSFEFFCKFHPNDMTGTVSIGVDPEVEDDVDVDVDVDATVDADEDAAPGDTTEEIQY